MSEKIGWIVATLLFITFVAFSFHLTETAARQAQVPIFMPLLDEPDKKTEPAYPPPPSFASDSAWKAPAQNDGTQKPPTEGIKTGRLNKEKSKSLELSGVEMMTILSQAGRLGPTVSIEDMVRGLLLLVKEGGNLALTQEQKKKLLPILKNAYERRKKLIQIQGRIDDLEENLPLAAADLFALLSEAQRRRIHSGRDNLSTVRFEDPYWEEIITHLEGG